MGNISSVSAVAPSDETLSTMSQLMDQVRAALSEEEKAALRDYFVFGFRRINAKARGAGYRVFTRQKKPDEAALDLIDAAFAKAPRLPQDLIVYRYVSKDLEELDDILNDPGIKSTSWKREWSHVYGVTPDPSTPIVMKIRVPAGTRFLMKAAIDATMWQDVESEILLPRCVRFKLLHPATTVYGAQGSMVILDAKAECLRDETPGDWRAQ